MTVRAARRANRERQRRCRARRDNGLAIYLVEISGSVLDLLTRLGWLADSDATKPQRVSAAISAMLADAARKT